MQTIVNETDLLSLSQDGLIKLCSNFFSITRSNLNDENIKNIQKIYKHIKNKNFRIELNTKEGCPTLLEYACEINNFKMVKMLIKEGADINHSIFGISPITIAEKHKNHRLLYYLLSHDPELNDEVIKLKKENKKLKKEIKSLKNQYIDTDKQIKGLKDELSMHKVSPNDYYRSGRN